MRFLSVLFWLLVIVLGAMFTALNPSNVTINYYLGTVQVYLPFLLVIELALGALIGIAIMLPALLRVRRRLRRARQKTRDTEKELQNLRTLPIKDSAGC